MIQNNTAAIIVIGDELLSGRTPDVNTPFLIDQLSKVGIKVKFCLMIPDDAKIIGRIVAEYSSLVKWVLISGGIGPTHDDITMESLASVFKVPLITHPELVTLLKKVYGQKCSPRHLKMAQVPEGTVLISTSRPNIPVIQFRNIFIFPGVPELMKTMFLLIKGSFKGDLCPVKEIVLAIDEGEILDELDQTIMQFSGVKIGSYPALLEDGYSVRIVMEHESKTYLNETFDFFEGKVRQFKRVN